MRINAAPAQAGQVQMSRIDQTELGGQPRFARGAAAKTPVISGPARRWLTKYGGTNIAIAAFCLVLIGIIWTVVVVQAQSEREDAIANAIRQNANLAMVF